MKRTLQQTLLESALALAVLGSELADACTRAVFIGQDGPVITGRSMDWAEDMQTNLWAFPRGMQRDGAAGPASPGRAGSRATAARSPRARTSAARTA